MSSVDLRLLSAMYERSGNTSMCQGLSALTEASDSAEHSYIQVAALSESGILCHLLVDEGVTRP